MKLSDLRKLDKDDLLSAMGLEESNPAGDFFTGLGLFAVGLLVGAGLGILFAPKRGSEMREQVGDVIRNRSRDAMDYAQQLGAEAGVSSPMPGSSPMTGNR